MRSLGLLLMAGGIVVLVYKGIPYTKTTQIINAGPLQASVQQDKLLYLTPAAGICAIVAGALLILKGRGQKSPW